jgi:sugar/nucleoside kinase (ribokinase family)
MVDVVVTGRGHDARAAVRPGGSAAIAAAWAAEAGAEATVVGSLGDDFSGGALRAALEAQGLSCLLSIDEEAPTGTFLLLDGEIRADPGANARLTPDELPERIDADGVLVSGYLQPATVAAALERADARWIVLSPGQLEQLPPGANALFVNEDEALRLTDAEPEDAARALGERFRLACVTRGAKGAVAVVDGELHATSAAPVPKSALGAGDAFAAATIVALSGGARLDEALAAGCEAGARAAALGPWPAG